jgi:hypothetical protein
MANDYYIREPDIMNELDTTEIQEYLYFEAFKIMKELYCLDDDFFQFVRCLDNTFNHNMGKKYDLQTDRKH